MADLSIFALVETTAEHFQRARQVQRLLASRSLRGRKVPDLLIAAAAEASGLLTDSRRARFSRWTLSARCMAPDHSWTRYLASGSPGETEANQRSSRY